METALKNPEPGNVQFSFYWEIFYPDLIERANVKQGHLQQLRLLCHLYVEYYKLSADISEEGYTTESDGGRNGPQVKPNLKVNIRERILGEIRHYSKLLKLSIQEDTKTKEPKEADVWK